jgi:hypothetical protein
MAHKEPAVRSAFRATLDRERTMPLLIDLGRKLRLKRSPLVAHMVTKVAGSRSDRDAVLKFYLQKWPELAPRRIDGNILVNWPEAAHTALRSISWEVLGTGNASETLRVLTAWFAAQHLAAR